MESENIRSKLKNKIIGEDLNKLTLCYDFALYLILLIWIIGFKCNRSWVPEVGEEMRSLPFWQRIRYVPFYDVINHKFVFGQEYLLNILLYIPFGAFLMFVFKKKKRIAVLIIAISSLSFEISQYFTGFGGCDISDFICNMLGGLIGIAIFLIFRKIIKDRMINYISFVASIIFTPIAVFAIVNTIINRQLYVIY